MVSNARLILCNLHVVIFLQVVAGGGEKVWGYTHDRCKVHWKCMFPFYCELMLAAIQKSNYTRTNLQAEIPPGEARTRWKPWLITLCCTGLSLTSSSLTDTQTDSKQVKRERNALTCTELSSGSVFSQSGQLQHEAFKQAVTRLQQSSWTIMSWTFWAQSISSYQRQRKKNHKNSLSVFPMRHIFCFFYLKTWLCTFFLTFFRQNQITIISCNTNTNIVL